MILIPLPKRRGDNNMQRKWTLKWKKYSNIQKFYQIVELYKNIENLL